MLSSFFNGFINSIGRTLGKIITYILIALILLILFGNGVKAETINDYCTKFWYANDFTGELGEKAYFCGPTAQLNAWGYNRYLDTCTSDGECWSEYLAGFNTNVNYSFEANSNYVIKMTVSYNGLQDGEFREDRLSRFNYDANFWVFSGATLRNVQYSNVRKLSNSTNDYTYLFDITWYFYTKSATNQIGLGFNGHRTSGFYYSFAFTNHYNDIIVTIPTVEVLKNTDETIIDQNQTQINQNDTIINQNQTQINQNDEAEKTRKGIWETIKDLPNQFLNMLKSLFIPDNDYFENWFNDLKTFFEQKLGFLATPFTIFIDFVNMYLNLNADTDIIINIPDVYVPNFEEFKIISATSFNWSELLKSKESLNTLWQLYLSFVDVFLILNFINLCENKYNRIFGGDTSNYEYYTVEDSITYDNNTGEVTGRRVNERRTTRKKV